jgi:methionyl-tRNA synthetase
LKEFLAEEAKAEEAKPAGPAPAAVQAANTEVPMEQITYDEFRKVDLRVALVLEAEKVQGATKLLKLKVDLGPEQRQLVAGVAETYKPEELVGKKVIIVANLKPAVIRGVESQGMILAAVADDKAVIPFFEREIAPGAVVK